MKKELKENKHYQIRINIYGRVEDYEGKVSKINGDEFRLDTEENNYCRALTLYKKDIIFSKEIPQPKKENKVFKVSNQKKFTDLKPSDEPDF